MVSHPPYPQVGMGMDGEEEDGGNESRRHLSFHIQQPEKSPGGVSFCLPGEGGMISNCPPLSVPKSF